MNEIRLEAQDINQQGTMLLRADKLIDSCDMESPNCVIKTNEAVPVPTKRKKAIKQIVKTNVKTAKGFVKFCYGLTWFLRILAVTLGLANILYVIFFSSYVVDIIFLILTFGFPYGLSFLPATVYIVSAGGEYRLRRRETITLGNGGFVYSYHDDRAGLSDTIFAFNILYENIGKYDYDDKTKILTLYGKIIGDTYENGELKASDEYNEISLLDVYDFSVKQLLDENC